MAGRRPFAEADTTTAEFHTHAHRLTHTVAAHLSNCVSNVATCLYENFVLEWDRMSIVYRLFYNVKEVYVQVFKLECLFYHDHRSTYIPLLKVRVSWVYLFLFLGKWNGSFHLNPLRSTCGSMDSLLLSIIYHWGIQKYEYGYLDPTIWVFKIIIF